MRSSSKTVKTTAQEQNLFDPETNILGTELEDLFPEQNDPQFIIQSFQIPTVPSSLNSHTPTSTMTTQKPKKPNLSSEEFNKILRHFTNKVNDHPNPQEAWVKIKGWYFGESLPGIKNITNIQLIFLFQNILKGSLGGTRIQRQLLQEMFENINLREAIKQLGDDKSYALFVSLMQLSFFAESVEFLKKYLDWYKKIKPNLILKYLEAKKEEATPSKNTQTKIKLMEDALNIVKSPEQIAFNKKLTDFVDAVSNCRKTPNIKEVNKTWDELKAWCHGESTEETKDLQKISNGQLVLIFEKIMTKPSPLSNKHQRTLFKEMWNNNIPLQNALKGLTSTEQSMLLKKIMSYATSSDGKDFIRSYLTWFKYINPDVMKSYLAEKERLVNPSKIALAQIQLIKISLELAIKVGAKRKTLDEDLLEQELSDDSESRASYQNNKKQKLTHEDSIRNDLYESDEYSQYNYYNSRAENPSYVSPESQLINPQSRSQVTQQPINQTSYREQYTSSSEINYQTPQYYNYGVTTQNYQMPMPQQQIFQPQLQQYNSAHQYQQAEPIYQAPQTFYQASNYSDQYNTQQHNMQQHNQHYNYLQQQHFQQVPQQQQQHFQQVPQQQQQQHFQQVPQQQQQHPQTSQMGFYSQRPDQFQGQSFEPGFFNSGVQQQQRFQPQPNQQMHTQSHLTQLPQVQFYYAPQTINQVSFLNFNQGHNNNYATQTSQTHFNPANNSNYNNNL